VTVVAVIAVVVFKKIQGLFRRKYLNPAGVAKLLVLVPLWGTHLIPPDHLIIDVFSFASLHEALEICYSYTAPFRNPLLTLTILKNHGWLGGASSVAVIIVGIGLITFSRGYVKWKIPMTYLATMAIISASYGLANGEDIALRVTFHVFTGSVIFLAFFMATDPPTTPITGVGQVIFAIGLGALTFFLQTYIQFLGGSILALTLMNLTTPLLDRIGLPKPVENTMQIKLPPAKKFGKTETTRCIRCGKCLTACCRNLKPIFIKEAVDKSDWAKARTLRADLCENCGFCSYMCPSRIDLRGAATNAKRTIQEPE